MKSQFITSSVVAVCAALGTALIAEAADSSAGDAGYRVAAGKEAAALAAGRDAHDAEAPGRGAGRGAAAPLDEQGGDSGPGITLAPGVTLASLFEVTASYEKAGDETSDINLDTVQFTLGAELPAGFRAEAVALWEEGEGDGFTVDSAFIEYGGTDELPLKLSLGRMYVDFGRFESSFISDPLTLELGETRATAARASFGNGLLSMSVAAFSGERDDDDALQNVAGAISLTPFDGVSFGVSAISDIGEGGYRDDIDDALSGGGSYGKAAGVSAFALVELGRLKVSAEYLAAAEDMSLASIDDDGAESRASWRPQAWFVEAGISLCERCYFALRYEGGKDFKADEFPETQFGGYAEYALSDCATLGAEYLYGKFDGDSDDRHLVSVRLALEF